MLNLGLILIALLTLMIAPVHGQSNSTSPLGPVLHIADGETNILARLRIPADMISESISQRFENQSAVDCIMLGTHSTGVATCLGEVRGALVDNPSVVEVCCTITGTVSSVNCGNNGPAIIRSTVRTNYSGTKKIQFNGYRFTTQPTSITGTTKLYIDSVSSSMPGLPGRIVRTVASRRAQESNLKAETIINCKTLHELQTKIDEEFENRLGAMNDCITSQFSVLKLLLASNTRLTAGSSRENIDLNILSPSSTMQFLPFLVPTRQPEGHHLSYQAIELWIP